MTSASSGAGQAMADSEAQAASPAPKQLDEGAHCHEVAPRLFIGDYVASQSAHLLDHHNIRSVVSAMKQRADVPGDRLVYRVPVDDSDKTNIMGERVHCSALTARAEPNPSMP